MTVQTHIGASGKTGTGHALLLHGRMHDVNLRQHSIRGATRLHWSRKAACTQHSNRPASQLHRVCMAASTLSGRSGSPAAGGLHSSTDPAQQQAHPRAQSTLQHASFGATKMLLHGPGHLGKLSSPLWGSANLAWQNGPGSLDASGRLHVVLFHQQAHAKPCERRAPSGCPGR